MYTHLHFIKRQRIETCLIIVGLSDSCFFEMETTEHPMIYLDYTTNPTQWRHHGRHTCKDQQNTKKTQIMSAQDSSTFKTFHQALGEEKPQGPPRTSLSNVGSFLSVCASMLITQWTACGSQFGAWSQSLSVVPCLSTGPLEVLLDEETDTCENQVITCWVGSSLKTSLLWDVVIQGVYFTLHWHLNSSFRKMKMLFLAKGRAGNMDLLGKEALFRFWTIWVWCWSYAW